MTTRAERPSSDEKQTVVTIAPSVGRAMTADVRSTYTDYGWMIYFTGRVSLRYAMLWFWVTQNHNIA